MKDYFIESRDRFWSHFHVYIKMFIWSIQLTVAVNDKIQQNREFILKTIKTILLIKENYDNDKYFNNDVIDIDDFNQCDFLILMLLKLRRVNLKDSNELFFKKVFFDITINDQLWTFIKHVKVNLAFARVIKTFISQKIKLLFNQILIQSQNINLNINEISEIFTTF